MVLVPVSCKRIFAVLASASIMALLVCVAAGPADAAVPDLLMAPPTLTGSNCLGNMKTVSWSKVAKAQGYRIVESWNTPFGPTSLTVDVPKSQTTAQVPVEFGKFTPVMINLFWAQAQPKPPKPPVAPYVQFGSLSYKGLQIPQAIEWDHDFAGPSMAGDGSVTVSFQWIVPSLDPISGGAGLATKVTVTASPGGQRITSNVADRPGGGLGVTDTFTGLTNGVPYSFTSIASNECGSSGPGLSPQFTPRAPGGLYCVVTSTSLPPTVPNAEQQVQVIAADGLSAITNIQIVNGTVFVPGFTPGSTSPITVTATKSDPSQRTSWSFDITDVNGRIKHCN